MTHESNKELSDLVIRDPLKTPREAVIREDSLLRKLTQRVYDRLPAEKKHPERFLFLNNVTHPKNVIDATIGAKCSACNTDCWVAPSSVSVLHNSTIICMQCLEKEAVVYEQESKDNGR